MELGLARIHLCKRQGLRWPELTGTGPAAATGVRASTGTGLRLASERVERLGGLLGDP